MPAIIKFNDKTKDPIIVGEFQFSMNDNIVLTESLHPAKEISFQWDIEAHEHMKTLLNEDVLVEMIAEKLKQDFIKFYHTL